MTLSSLRNRVRRLEESCASRPRFAQLLRRARERWESMTSQQQAAERCKDASEAVASLQGGEYRGDDLEARLERARRRSGVRHLAAMAALDEPDLPVPPALSSDMRAADMEARIVADVAWHDQQHRRAEARRYLADVALAADLFKETT